MKKFLLLALVAPLWLTGCSDDKKSDKPKSDKAWENILTNLGFAPSGFNVVDETGAPVAGAKILIGHASGTPFAGNFLVTDAQGHADTPAEWTTDEPVTVQAPGYVRLTYLAQSPKAISFKLRKVNVPPTFELTGVTNGHPVVDKDGYVDFGLVISAMSRADALAFDLTKVVSNESDHITVVGQDVEIPSNITLPRQKETYFLPITLDKPAYRMYFAEKGIQRVFAARGRFPFKEVIDQVRAKTPFYQLINYFTISGGSVKDIDVKSNQNRKDFDVNEIRFTDKLNVKAPALPDGKVFIAAAVADMNGYMIPTDFKKLESNEKMPLAIMKGQPPMIVGVVKNEDEFEGKGADRLSSVILPFKDGVTPQPLGLIADPRVAADGDLLITRPAVQAGVSELATYGLLSEVREVTLAQGTTKLPIRMWEVYAPGFVSTLDLPVWPEGTPAPAHRRWEATYIGSVTNTQSDLGAAVIDASTHVTHSSVDF